MEIHILNIYTKHGISTYASLDPEELDRDLNAYVKEEGDYEIDEYFDNPDLCGMEYYEMTSVPINNTPVVMVPNDCEYNPIVMLGEYTPGNVREVLKQELPGWKIREINSVEIYLEKGDQEMDLAVYFPQIYQI